ncbi:MAG TPA: putative porin [Chitinophagaceae bacterium]|nr:putative porin [Chitinophagaceae bacterium]
MLNTALRYGFFSLLLLLMLQATAQVGGRLGNMGNRMRGGGGGGDSLQRRDRFEDSLTINYRFLDSSRTYTFDSSISDYSTRFPIPPTHVYLGNVGTATHSLLFSPNLKSGWDPGFHAYDVYKLKLEDVRFFNTTRPYTELGYMLGTQTQQIIEVSHTQNIRPYWNFSLRYRLINTPGFFQNQKANHNNYAVTSWYQSPNKRYNNYFILLSNAMQAGENGGITDTISLKDPDYSDRFNIPVRLGGNAQFSRDFKRTVLTTGNRYVETNVLLRQQYDLGRKDSLVTDSTVIPLFYPRLRFEHTFTYGKYNYYFQNAGGVNYQSDSTYYQDNYHIALPETDSLFIQDRWREVTNDFSIYQFPDAKNLQQFIKVGLTNQILNGRFAGSTKTLYNLAAHGEYRNRTRNKKWDVLAYGNLYLNGYNAGDYQGYISLQRYLGTQWGSLQVGFQNVNRSPEFIYDTRSSFYLDTVGGRTQNFKKENTAHFFGTVTNPKLNLTLGADYYLVTNYLYLTHFSDFNQESTLFNVLRISATKTARFGRHGRLYSSVWVQQKAGNAEVKFPLFYTRNRLAFEGNFFKNLFLSTGLELRYHSPYKADGYSPVLGRFYYQDAIQIKIRPQLDLFFNFRIRSFKAYIRAENLNAASLSNGGFSFSHNNFAAPGYPYPGMVVRFGFFWSFVN